MVTSARCPAVSCARECPGTGKRSHHRDSSVSARGFGTRSGPGGWRRDAVRDGRSLLRPERFLCTALAAPGVRRAGVVRRVVVHDVHLPTAACRCRVDAAPGSYLGRRRRTDQQPRPGSCRCSPGLPRRAAPVTSSWPRCTAARASPVLSRAAIGRARRRNRRWPGMVCSGHPRRQPD